MRPISITLGSLLAAAILLGHASVQAQMPDPYQMPDAYQLAAYQAMQADPGVYKGQGLGVAPTCMPQQPTPNCCPDALGFGKIPCDPCNCQPRITFMGEAMAMQRTPTRSQPLFLSARGETVLNSQDLNFPVAYGSRVGATIHDVYCWDVEVTYFQLDGFAAEGSVPDTSRMVTDMNQETATVTDGTCRYTSALYNGELNFRQHWNDWFTFIVGYRMVELDEHYRADGMGVNPSSPVELDIGAINHLHGFQLGAEAEIYNMGGPLTITGLCKAGIYQNWANQHTHRAYSTADDTLSASRDRTAFLGEVGVLARYAITQRLAFRASYEAMWLEGVALAPDQIGVSNFASDTATVNYGAGVFYHGGNIGFEYRF